MRTTGYSPFICFNVADMDSTIVRCGVLWCLLASSASVPLDHRALNVLSVGLCPDIACRLLQMGAALDGPIKYPAYGKVIR